MPLAEWIKGIFVNFIDFVCFCGFSDPKTVWTDLEHRLFLNTRVSHHAKISNEAVRPATHLSHSTVWSEGFPVLRFAGTLAMSRSRIGLF